MAKSATAKPATAKPATDWPVVIDLENKSGACGRILVGPSNMKGHVRIRVQEHGRVDNEDALVCLDAGELQALITALTAELEAQR